MKVVSVRVLGNWFSDQQNRESYCIYTYIEYILLYSSIIIHIPWSSRAHSRWDNHKECGFFCAHIHNNLFSCLIVKNNRSNAKYPPPLQHWPFFGQRILINYITFAIIIIVPIIIRACIILSVYVWVITLCTLL